METHLTPLGRACAEGNMSAVEELLNTGADANAIDAQGWTAKEHAAYRGHLRVAAHLESVAPRTSKPLLPASTVPVKENKSYRANVPWTQRDFDTYDGVYVWITMGSIDATNAVPVFEPNRNKGHSLDEQNLMISVSDEREPNATYIFLPPGNRSRINKPFLFRTNSCADLRLVWKLTAQLPSGEPRTLGIGITMAKDWDSGLGANKESLRRGASVALQGPDASFVGSINYSHFSITPHRPPPELREPKCWKFGNGVGGHRGSGKNRMGHNQLQIGENSIQSFQTAVAQDAAFLEFDVQLTKDLVPVVYHDLLLSEMGVDTRMHDLTFEQFDAINKDQGPRLPREKRSNSLIDPDTSRLDAISSRMSNTHFNRTNGFKSNTRGSFIREDTITLDDLFRTTSTDVALNVEIKYPMLFESHDWAMEPLAISASLYVDTILDIVYKHALERTIVFSSFNPEICIALSNKQRTWPVFFLSKTLAPKGDVRSQSVEQAAIFAKAWGLPGIVVECTPLIQCPRLVDYVKGMGLSLMSFGAANSDPESARVQFDAGIDAVITDTVGAIVRLRKDMGYQHHGEQIRRIFP